MMTQSQWLPSTSPNGDQDGQIESRDLRMMSKKRVAMLEQLLWRLHHEEYLLFENMKRKMGEHSKMYSTSLCCDNSGHWVAQNGAHQISFDAMMSIVWENMYCILWVD
jgi:hypothetical protein